MFSGGYELKNVFSQNLVAVVISYLHKNYFSFYNGIE